MNILIHEVQHIPTKINKKQIHTWSLHSKIFLKNENQRFQFSLKIRTDHLQHNDKLHRQASLSMTKIKAKIDCGIISSTCREKNKRHLMPS